MLGYFLTSALCLVQLININELSFDYNPIFSRKRILKPLVNYGVYTLFSSITLTLIQNIDLLMIGALMPENKLEHIGIYAIATFIVSIIYIPKNALMRISSPIIAHNWKKRNLKEIAELHKKSAIILIFLGGYIFGCIVLNLDSLLFFLKPEYSAAKYIIIILGLSRLLDMFFGFNYLILVVTKFYRMESFLAISLLFMIIITNYIFIPIYGIFGAAITTALGFLINNIILFYYNRKKLKMHPFSWDTIKIIFIGISAGTIVYFLKIQMTNQIALIFLKSSIFSSLFIIPVYCLKISSDINSIINKILSLFKF